MTDPSAPEPRISDDTAPPSPDEDSFPLDRLIGLTLHPLEDEEADDLEAGWADAPGATIPSKTLHDLDWERVVGLVAEKAVTPEGQSLIPRLPPLPDKPAVKRRLHEVSEAMRMLDEDEDPPLRGQHDIRRALNHVERDGVLVAEDLEAIGRNCDGASRVGRYLKNRSREYPYLAAVGDGLDPCEDLREALNQAIEPGGRLSDKASPDIAKLRRAVQNQHDRLKARVDSLLRSEDLEEYLQDDYYTVREDRYVLPVRVDQKTHVPGIVHGYSSSGKTAFIEPRELVDINNELRWAQIELEEEENRILQRLSRLVSKHVDALRRNADRLAYLDVVTASARFGQETIQGSIPEITEQRMALRELKHPLLWVQNAHYDDDQRQNETVTNDVHIDPDKQTLVVSGPNTGGKTVLLKAMGLSALMARCGLPIPAGDDSQVPLYSEVFSDIGDEQSIERDLSTFSAHLTNINSFLDRTSPESLVLLDELFTGTDPLEGAALATALLEDLSTRGSTTVVTTHLEGLKTLALQDDTFANASMGFDLDDLEPTYRVTMGVPGSSFALRIADRLGFPERLITRATNVLEGDEHHGVDEVIASLEDQMTELRKERTRMEEARRKAEQSESKYREKYEKLRDREREMVHDETRELKEQLNEAREMIREKIKTLQRANRVERGDIEQRDLHAMQEELKDAEDTIEEATDKTRPPETGPAGLVRIQNDELEEGMEAYVHAYQRKGTVTSYDAGDNQAKVQIGALKVTADVDDLYYPSEKDRRSHVRGRSGSGNSSGSGSSDGAGRSGKSSVPRTEEHTLDVRGQRVQESIDSAANFLDQKFLDGFNAVMIIHGKGTGALRRGIRDYLADSPYVASWREGDRDEGGDGVTVVELAEEIHG